MIGKLLDGKSVVITGAGSGVGRAAALLFSEHGAKLILADIQEELLAEAVDAVKAQGGTARGAKCDVSKRADVQAAVDAAVADYGRLDVMYNNAGIASPSGDKGKKFFYDNTDEEFELLFRVNTFGVLYGVQIAIRQFRKQHEAGQGQGGVVVNTASVAGLFGWGGPLYGATKGAITNFTRSIATEMAPEQIRINSVCPGAMITRFGPWGKGPPPQAMLDHVASTLPMGHIPTAEDSARGALYLASDLSQNVTGINLPVDGGMMAGK